MESSNKESSILKNQLEESKTIEELINDDSVVLAKQVVLLFKILKIKMRY